MIRGIFLCTLFVFTLFAKEVYTNDLIKESSPYLLQHAHNPVNWVAYDETVFEKAKAEDKLVFLSIGYSTCHWCHVMEEESFENREIATLLNRDYISVKVDKEEMPQIDTHYQQLHALFHKGRNGWPLTVILTPNKEIVYIATYVPAEDNYGIEGLKTLLPSLAKGYHDKQLTKIILDNQKVLADKTTFKPSKKDISPSLLYLQKMQKRYDKVFKGFDRRPRFPLASNLNLLLDIYFLDGNKTALDMAKETLDVMAKGGIYDQVEGGFYRYSTYPDWVVPHFEKMLYTQAELIPLYVKLYQLTGKDFYKHIVKESVDETIRIFEDKGLFYAATDADSEGMEGGYFLYRYENVLKALQEAGYNKKEIEENLEYFDISEVGNFEEGYSNPQCNTGIDTIPKRVDETKKILKRMREKKQFPFIDQKVITSWNAMMIKTLFMVAKIYPSYLSHAQVNLEALLAHLYHDNVLYHQYIEGKPLKVKGLLEDYAFLIDALIEAYMATEKKHFFVLAERLTKEAIKKFYHDNVWYLDEAHFAKATYNDKYYTAPISRLYHDMLNVAYLNYDLRFLTEVKGYIKAEKERILHHIDKSPEATRALIRISHDNVILKANGTLLRKYKEDIDKILYPFFLRKVEKVSLFLLCNERSCFFYDKNITKVIKKMKGLRK